MIRNLRNVIAQGISNDLDAVDICKVNMGSGMGYISYVLQFNNVNCICTSMLMYITIGDQDISLVPKM